MILGERINAPENLIFHAFYMREDQATFDIKNNLTCLNCANYIDGGDFNLCCKVKYDLCYKDTPACEEFVENEQKQ